MKCLIAGASGLVGQALLKELIAGSRFSSIVAVGRQPIDAESAALSSLVIKFADLPTKISSRENQSASEIRQTEKVVRLPEASVAFCTLGTTIKTAGSREAFYEVDHDFVIGYAQAALRAGVKTFVVVSALGADAHSRVFYNRVKGETEQDLRELGFNQLIILQPSLLLGNRQEHRPSEKFAQRMSKVLGPLMIGPLAKSRPIEASKVAKRMAELGVPSESMTPMTRVILNHEI